MAIQFETVGTGLTKRVNAILEIESIALAPAQDGSPERFILTLKEPADAGERRALERHMEEVSATSTVEGLVTPWESWAREILARAGFPPLDRVVRIDTDGRWADDLPEDGLSRAHEICRPGESIGDAITVAQLRDGIDSPEWFAATILQAINLVREVIARGETAWAAHLALKLSMEIATALFKLTWEPDTLTGKKIHAAVSHGGRQRARAQREAVQQRHANWQHAAENQWQKNPA